MSFSKKILSFFVVVLTVAAGFYIYNDKYVFSVQEATVDIMDGAVSPKLKERLVGEFEGQLNKYKKMNIWQISLQEVQTRLLQNGWAKEVLVSRELPDAIRISITLSDIAFVFVDSKKRFVPITYQGVKLGPIPLQLLPDVPITRDKKLVDDETILQKVVALYSLLPKTGILGEGEIAEIHWHDKLGLQLELTRYEGRVVLGAKNISLRAKRVANVLKYLESQKQKWRVIDAAFSKKVLVRLRKQS